MAKSAGGARGDSTALATKTFFYLPWLAALHVEKYVQELHYSLTKDNVPVETVR